MKSTFLYSLKVIHLNINGRTDVISLGRGFINASVKFNLTVEGNPSVCTLLR